MIRELSLLDLDEVNKLLSTFNYEINNNTFDNEFFKALIYIDEEIKGIIVYSLIYDRIEIEYIVVSNDCRRSGIGTKLLSEIEKYNVKNISLEVRVSNKSAISFYEQNGYKIKATRRNYYKTEDAYLMIKELGE